MTEDEIAALNAAEQWRYSPTKPEPRKNLRPAAGSKWALPTTGNLANDDYRRSLEAYMKSMRGVITGWTPGVTTGEGTEYYQQTAGNPIYGNQQGDERNWEAEWTSTLTPEQRAERIRLEQERHAKLKRNGMLAALAGFGGIAGAGMLGAGMLGVGAGGAGAGAAELGGGLSALDGLGGLGQFGGLDAIAGTGGLGSSLGGLEAAGGALGAAGGAAELGGGLSALDGLGGLGQFGGLDSIAGTGGLGAGGGVGTGSAAAAGGGMDWQSIVGALSGGGNGGGVNWTNLLGNLGGGLINSYTAGKASDAQVNSAQAANALLKYMYDQSRADQAPYRQAGTSALAGIQRLLKDPSSITAMPDYKFGLDQGTKALENSASARGMTYSGQQAKALTKYGNDYANSKLDSSYNRLAGIAGIGQVATNNTGALGANYANNAASNLTDMGNARGAGYIGQSNAWGNAIGGALNGFQDQALIDALLKRGGP